MAEVASSRSGKTSSPREVRRLEVLRQLYLTIHDGRFFSSLVVRRAELCAPQEHTAADPGRHWTPAESLVFWCLRGGSGVTLYCSALALTLGDGCSDITPSIPTSAFFSPAARRSPQPCRNAPDNPASPKPALPSGLRFPRPGA